MLITALIRKTATLLGKVTKDVVKDLAGPVEKIEKLAAFLHRYGYLADGEISIEEVVDAISKLQKNYALPIDGQVDAKLLSAIELPRCGCVDVQRLASEALTAKWTKSNLTYGIASYVDEFAQNETRDILDKAFQAWENVTNLNISYSANYQNADIIISTGRGPRDGFDGPSKTLAWAYLPDGNNSQLLMKFDVDELWVKDPSTRGIVMFNVACHEFGHLLGLDHSSVSAALMAPYYNVNIAVPQKNDDIPRIQALYGVKNPTTPTTPTNPSMDEVTITLKGSISNISIPGYTVKKN